MKVLVTGAGALLGQGIIRSLRMSVLDVQITAVDPSPYAVGLYWADRSARIPLASDVAFVDALRGLLNDEEPDALLVGTDTELPKIAEMREELEREFGTRILVSDPGVVAIADDKWLTYKFLRDTGFPYPDSCLPGTQEELLERVGFPLIVKPRVGARSIGVHRVETRAALNDALAAVPGAIIQECVATDQDEYTAGALCFPGQAVASIVMRRELRDGNTYRAFVEVEKPLDAAVRRLANALRPLGPVNFQFRRDGEAVKVFEINARFSGTTPFRARAGFNEVEMALRYLVEGAPVHQPELREVSFLRYWDEIMLEPGEFRPSTPGLAHDSSAF